MLRGDVQWKTYEPSDFHQPRPIAIGYRGEKIFGNLLIAIPPPAPIPVPALNVSYYFDHPALAATKRLHLAPAGTVAPAVDSRRREANLRPPGERSRGTSG